MSTVAHKPSGPSSPLTATWTILRITFALVPVLAGLDKFTNILVNWESYLNPVVLRMLPLGAHTVLGIIGIVEIAAGILVLARPRLGAFVVTAWLLCISLSLIAGGNHYDVAVRDLVMAVGAFALGNLTAAVEREKASALPASQGIVH